MKHTPFISLFLVISSLTFANPIDLTIGIQEGAGLYAELHKVLQSIIHYEKDLTSVHVDWTDEFFPYKDDPHENGWDLFFEPISVASKPMRSGPIESVLIDSTSVLHELHDQCCTAPWVGYNAYLPYRKFVNQKLTQYIKLKPELKAQLDSFFYSKIHDFICIGVHARIARAHAALVPGRMLPSVEDYFQEVDHLLKKHPGRNVRIFVASDSHMGVQKFKERYGDKVVYINAHRSKEDQDPCTLYTNGKFLKKNTDVWHRIKHKTFGGITTILDCLLLAKCDYLIHTTSNLAFFSTYYNPEIKSIYLPKGVPFKNCVVKDNPSIVNPFLNPI